MAYVRICLGSLFFVTSLYRPLGLYFIDFISVYNFSHNLFAVESERAYWSISTITRFLLHCNIGSAPNIKRRDTFMLTHLFIHVTQTKSFLAFQEVRLAPCIQTRWDSFLCSLDIQQIYICGDMFVIPLSGICKSLLFTPYRFTRNTIIIRVYRKNYDLLSKRAYRGRPWSFRVCSRYLDSASTQ